MHLTRIYRLQPTRAQHAKLNKILEGQRQLYNAALEERISCYAKTGRLITKFDQFNSLTELRKEPDFKAIPAVLQRSTLERLNNAFKGFFRRLKTTAKAGFPRFQSKNSWKSFGFISAPIIRENRVYFKGMGSLRFIRHIELDGVQKSAWIKRDHKGWLIGIVVEVETATSHNISEIGIDLGLSDLAILSDGSRISNKRFNRKAEKQQRILQRALSRCRKGSQRRLKVKAKLTRQRAKVANQRQTYLHQVSAELIRKYGTIYLEDLNIKGLSRGMLAKSVHDVAWAKFIFYLTYKAERAGGQVVRVDPRYTSQICSGCGCIEKKKLSERTHSCVHCGLVLDRDHNAAINIAARGRSVVSDSVTWSVGTCVESEILV